MESLLELGEAEHDHHGGTVNFFSKRVARKTRAAGLLRVIESKRKVYGVAS